MPYLYSGTVPNSSKSQLSALAIAFSALPARDQLCFALDRFAPSASPRLGNDHPAFHLPPPRPPLIRELSRRLEYLREIRRALALSPGDDTDFAAWLTVRKRGDRLSRITVSLHLSQSPCIHLSSGPPIPLP